MNILLKPFYGQTYKKFLKRFLDIVLSLILIILFLPLALVIAILIKLDSSGPIFADVPERVGENGKKFKMYKFRSMIVNAHYLLRTDKRFKKLYEEYQRGNYKLKDDPRVTKIGRFIRKHSLDEIPQLFNVLKGEMSLVGPRPHEPEEVARYDRHQKQLLTIKPGITGLAQISGRSNLPFDEEAKLDIYYMENWSLSFDLQILIKTIPVVLGRRSAY